MLRPMALLALPLISFTYLHGSAATAHVAPRGEDGVQCEVRSTQAPRGAQLEAVAIADRAVTGEYQFEVEKQGSAGTSQTAQSGEFTLQPGKENILSEVSVSVGDHASYTARLTLQWGGGQMSCSTSNLGGA